MTNEDILIAAQRNGLLLDTNLLVLYLVGQTDEGMVEKHKRTSQYTVDDYRLLLGIVHSQRKLVTTPHVLAEVSNIATFTGSLRHRFHDLFEAHIGIVEGERYLAGRDICRSPAFRNLGITDAGLVLLSIEGVVVMTDDLDLYLSLQSNRAAAINFTRLRNFG